MDDERVMQEFAELQEQVLMTSDANAKLTMQERNCHKQKMLSTLTKQELQSMPGDTLMYKSVGRAYFLAPTAAVLEELDSRVEAYDADIKKAKEQRDAIELKQKDTETQLRELISQSPTLARRLGAVKI